MPKHDDNILEQIRQLEALKKAMDDAIAGGDKEAAEIARKAYLRAYRAWMRAGVGGGNIGSVRGH